MGGGNLGRAIAANILKTEDFILADVFSRRGGSADFNGRKAKNIGELSDFREKTDVLFLAGSSSEDLPLWAPFYSRYFNVVDSFDCHEKIKAHIEKTDITAKASGHTAVLSAGWDPGLFSLMRVMFKGIDSTACVNTLWGKGISMGHSSVLKTVEGVKYGVQFTIPSGSIRERLISGERKVYLPQESHKRLVYAVLEGGADRKKAEADIKNIEGYYRGYNTEVIFCSEKELSQLLKDFHHGGTVTFGGEKSSMNFTLQTDSNPEITAEIMVGAARAAVKLNREGCFGAKTLADIPLKYLCGESFSYNLI